MVQAAFLNHLSTCQGSPFSWYHNEHRRELYCTDYDGAAKAGQMLWDENVKSVRHRYPDCDDELPGPIGCDYQYGEHNAYQNGHIDPVAVLKACDGYEYQSCEHEGWEESEAKAFVDALRHRAWHALPGYADADWEIRDERAEPVAECEHAQRLIAPGMPCVNCGAMIDD